jgi:hypothetical protein
VSRSVAWIDFLSRSPSLPTHRRPAQLDTGLRRDPFLQLCNGDVGMAGDQFHHPGGQCGTDPALAPGPIGDPFHLAALRPLAEDLLHIAQADPEQLRQFSEAPVTLPMRLEYLAAQIVLVGSRHLVFVAGVSRITTLHNFRYCPNRPGANFLFADQQALNAKGSHPTWIHRGFSRERIDQSALQVSYGELLSLVDRK